MEVSTVNGKLRELRTYHNLSADDLAKYLNCCRDTIYRYERGEQQPRADQLVKLAYLYNTSTDAILEDFKNKACNFGQGGV